MEKRGQLTQFMIIGLLLLFLIFFLIYLKEENIKGIIKDKKTETINLADPIRIFVEQCLEETTKNSIELVALQGGYYHPPELSYDLDEIKVPFYFYSGSKNIPEKEAIEQQIKMFVTERLPLCLEGFSRFKEQGITVAGEIKAINIDFGADTTITIDYPLDITKDDSITKLSSFSYSLPFDLNKIHNFILGYAAEQEKDINYSQIGYLTDMAYKNNYVFKVIDLSDSKFIYLFYFDAPWNENKYLMYQFAVKY